jgi:hypothetical protein
MDVGAVLSYCNKQTCCIRVRVAGVLLGKARLDSLYGQNSGCRARATVLGDADQAGIPGLRRRLNE